MEQLFQRREAEQAALVDRGQDQQVILKWFTKPEQFKQKHTCLPGKNSKWSFGELLQKSSTMLLIYFPQEITICVNYTS